MDKRGGSGRALKWAAGVVVVLILLPGLFLALLQSGAARTKLAAFLSSALSTGGGVQVTFSRPEGLVPFTVRFERITASDADGVWMVAEKAVLSWSPSALLRGRIDVEEIGASSVRIERLPAAPPKDEQRESRPFSLPRKLPPVTVERLSIPEIYLGEAALGEAGLFEVEGSVSPSAHEGGIAASLRLARKGGPETRGDVRVSYRAPDARLDVKLDFHEAADGWVATVMGYRNAGGIDVLLEGSGSIEDWKGRLSASTGRYGTISSEITTKGERTTALGLHGAYQPPRTDPPSQGMRVMTAGARFAMDATISEHRLVILERAEFLGEGFQVRTRGKIDLESRDMDGSWELEAEDLQRFEPLVGRPVAGNLSASGTVSGAWESLRGSVAVDLRDLKLDQMLAQTIEARLSFEPIAAQAPSGRGFKVVGSGKAEELVFAGAESLPERSYQWSFDLEIRDGEPVSIGALEVVGKSHSLELKGDIDPGDLTGTIEATIHARDTGQLSALLGRDLPAEAVVAVHLTGDGRARNASAHIDGRFSGMENLPDSMAALFSPEVILVGDVELLQGKGLTVSSLRVENKVFRFDGKGRVDLEGESITGSWQLVLPDLAAMGPAFQRDLSGTLKAEGEIEGLFTALTCRASLAGNEIVLNGRKLRKFTAGLSAEDVPARPHGALTLELKQDGRDLSSSAGFALDGRQLRLAPLSVKAAETAIKGDVVLHLETGLASGAIEGKGDDLSVLGRLVGEPLGGSARFKAKLAAGKTGQDVQVSARADAFETRLGAAKELSLSADLKDVWGAPRGDASLTIREADISGVGFQDFLLKGSTKSGKGQFELSAHGRAEEDFGIRSLGAFSLSRDATRVKIETLEGHYGKYPLKLLEPAAFQRSGTALDLASLVLSLGSGRFEASGSLAHDLVRVDSEFRGFPLDMMALRGGPDLAGAVAGNLRLSGNPSNPTGRIQLSLSDVRTRTGRQQGLPAAAVSVEAKLESGRLTSNARIDGIFDKPATADLSVPMALSLSPFAYSVPPEGSVQGHLEVSADLGKLAAFLPSDEHRAAGNLEAGFNIGGTVAHPQVDGDAVVSGGSYHNLMYGTVLKDLSARIVSSGGRLVVEELKATDGGTGRIRGGGWVEVDGSGHFPLSLEAGFTDAKLIRRDDATGSLGGSIKISGSVRDMAMDGKLEIGSADVLLPKKGRQPLAELKVVEINVPEGRSEPPKPPRRASPVKLRMDLAVSSPGRIIVHGRNLNSEWKGSIRISGTSDKPVIKGALSLVRGQYTFLDKPFKLLEGAIQFYGSSPPQPTLRIIAESRTKAVTARLLLTGTFSDPKLELQSEPPLPQDEILSRVLFGRSLSAVTPLQAGKLALALRSLSGKGDTLDLLERTRKLLRVEQVELRDVNGETALGLGKYLTEDVYVDVEKGLGSEPGKVSVQVELTPNITLETEAGTDASKGIQLEWKYDY
jgi:translocation and assembly module TamB